MRDVLRRPTVALALLATATLMTAHFALVPNIAAYWQFNPGYSRERLGMLFVVGGAVSFATMRLAGRLADRARAAATAAGATAFYVAVLLAAFAFPSRAPPALLLFVGFMAASTMRSLPMQGLASRVPLPHERARFMSAQSVVQHLGAATGSLVASSMLSSVPGGRLAGMATVASGAAVVAATVPGLLWGLERRIRVGEVEAGREFRRRQAPAAAPSSHLAR